MWPGGRPPPRPPWPASAPVPRLWVLLPGGWRDGLSHLARCCKGPTRNVVPPAGRVPPLCGAHGRDPKRGPAGGVSHWFHGRSWSALWPLCHLQQRAPYACCVPARAGSGLLGGAGRGPAPVPHPEGTWPPPPSPPACSRLEWAGKREVTGLCSSGRRPGAPGCWRCSGVCPRAAASPSSLPSGDLRGLRSHRPSRALESWRRHHAGLEASLRRTSVVTTRDGDVAKG